MKGLLCKREMIKSVLIVSLLAVGVSMSGIASAKARFYMNLCFVPPPNYTSLQGTGSSNFSTTGGIFNNAYTWPGGSSCSSNMNLMADDTHTGDFDTWPIGGAEYDFVRIYSPLVVISGGQSGTCQTYAVLKMVVFSISPDGYRNFGPAVGNTGSTSGPGNLRVNITWPLGASGPTCTTDYSGL